MTVTFAWTIAARHRLHGLAEGPVTPCVAEYTLSGEAAASVPLTPRVPLTLPLGPPASAGKAVISLPGPPGGGDVKRAVLFAEDGTELMTIACDPPEHVEAGRTWTVTIAAPDLDASSFMDAPQDVVLHVGGRDYPCDVLRDEDQDSGGIAAWLVVPREPLPAGTEGMTVTAGTLPARTSLILHLGPDECDGADRDGKRT